MDVQYLPPTDGTKIIAYFSDTPQNAIPSEEGGSPVYDLLYRRQRAEFERRIRCSMQSVCNMVSDGPQNGWVPQRLHHNGLRL